MKKHFLLFTFFLFSLLIGYSQTPDILWSKTYGGSEKESMRSMVNTKDGGYLVVGSTKSGDGDVHRDYDGTNDGWVVKLNDNLDTLWTKSFNKQLLSSPNNTVITTVDTTHDGGYILAGYFDWLDPNVQSNGRVAWIIKLDSYGNIVWDETMAGSQYNYFKSVRQTSDSGFVFIGSSKSNDGDEPDDQRLYDYWVVKFDAGGNLVFSKTFGGTNNDYGMDVCPVNNDGYIVVGETRSQNEDVHGNHGYYDAWILRLDADGDTIWTKCFGGTGSDELRSIVATSDGNYILAGYSNSDDGDVNDNYGGRDCWLIKIDANGDLVWSNNYGGTASDRGGNKMLC